MLFLQTWLYIPLEPLISTPIKTSIITCWFFQFSFPQVHDFSVLLLLPIHIMMMNCFCGMVHQRKEFRLFLSWDHCQKSSPSRTSNISQAGFEPVQNLSSGFIEWSCTMVIITTPQNHTNLKRLWSQTSLSSLSSLCRCIQIFWLTFHLVRDVINLLYSLCRSLIIFFLCIFSLLNSSNILETNVMVL